MKKMSKQNIVQLNNQYIQDENLKSRYQEERIRKNNRFMGWVLIFIILLLILPTYKLINSYTTLQQQKAKIVTLQKEYQQLEQETSSEQTLADQLKNDDYVAKYARAKYYLSKSGEVVYTIPSLLPK